MSSKREKTKKREHEKKTKRTITRAVTHIGLIEANPGQLEALDRLVTVYLVLCQQYVRLLCTQEVTPDKYASPAFETELSERWHRVAIQQAAGIAKSWRTNRQAAYEGYLEDLANWKFAQEASPNPKRKAPTWKEWHLPELRVPCIQATVNVVWVEPSE